MLDKLLYALTLCFLFALNEVLIYIQQIVCLFKPALMELDDFFNNIQTSQECSLGIPCKDCLKKFDAQKKTPWDIACEVLDCIDS